MSEEMKKDIPSEEVDIITLTDEDGKEIDFEIVGEYEKDGQRYFAMIPLDEENENSEMTEYVILKLAVEDGEEVLVTVDDDDELDDVADYFDDYFSQEIDYDN
ncbi:MAG: DUF1292 domain-containing protein [Ruminococcaceae bacterium]|nr:DUF1292 domain-containing protein [Oscillospiraceae bacterium]